MKKIFYKIFFTLLIITYIPLILLYSFHGFYMKEYVENQKISELKDVTYSITEDMIKNITEEEKKKIEKKKDVTIEVVDENDEKRKTEVFKYLNERFWNIDLDNMPLNSVEVKFEKSTNLLNKVHIIKNK